MGRIRPIYSESHDHSLFPPKTGKGRKRKAATPLLPQLPAGSPPNTSVGLLPKNLSDEQRVSLRARQLLAERDVRSLPLQQIQDGNGPIDRPPVPDHDIYDRKDLDVADPRGEQFSDGRKTVFPEALGERMDREFMRILSEEKEHPPLPDFEHPSQVNAAKELIAAVRADDQTILAFDNELTTLHTTLRRLRQKAERMAQSVRKTDDNPAAPDSPTNHANNVVQLITRIIEPWYMALDDEFNQLLSGTEQGKAVEEGAL